MAKHRPSYDESEYMAHLPKPNTSNEPPSLFSETTEYLKGAEERIAKLTPVPDFAEAIKRVESRGYVPPQPDPSIDALRRSAESLPKPKGERGLGAVLKKNPPKPPPGMARNRDHSTSLAAALALEPQLNALQQQILDAFRHEGAMHDERLEQLPEFSGYKYSTARKRRTELVAKGLLSSCGKALNSTGSARMTLWDLTERVKPLICSTCNTPTYWQSGNLHLCSDERWTGPSIPPNL